MSDLKPCPFCGGTPVTGIKPFKNAVRCDNCYAFADNAEVWNRRDDAYARGVEDAARAVACVEIPEHGLPQDRIGVWLAALREADAAISALAKAEK